MKLRFIISGLPKMANGGHGSWQRIAGERKKWHKKIARELVGLTPQKPFTKIKATMIRHSSSEPDFDGLVHGFKPVIDALVKLGVVVNDKSANVISVYKWERAPKGKGHIEIEIESIDA